MEQALQESARLTAERAAGDAEAEAERFERLRKKLKGALAEAGLERDIRASYDERGLVLSLVSRHVVFENNLASLSSRGLAVVDALASVLGAIDDHLQVDGHTNQVPVKPKYFATDWDLSAARAVTVLRRLEEVGKISTSRLSLAAFGHSRPLVPPDEPGSQAINKRVDVVVLSQPPATTDGARPESRTTRNATRHASPLPPASPPSADETTGSALGSAAEEPPIPHQAGAPR